MGGASSKKKQTVFFRTQVPHIRSPTNGSEKSLQIQPPKHAGQILWGLPGQPGGAEGNYKQQKGCSGRKWDRGSRVGKGRSSMDSGQNKGPGTGWEKTREHEGQNALVPGSRGAAGGSPRAPLYSTPTGSTVRQRACWK